MPVNARRLIRKMRGGAQAHLIECDDGLFYVVKFVNNPQHRRVLVNEWIGTVFLRYLQIAGPGTAVVNVTSEFLEANPEVHFQLGSRRAAVEPGWHFGSAYPGNPSKLAVYDFIPDLLLGKVVNLADFLGVLVFDKWSGNADARQSIFFRARLQEWMPAYDQPSGRLGFVAHMMDHGFILGGPQWSFAESPLQGLYFRPVVYEKVTGFRDFQPWLDRVVHFPEEIVDEACKQLPPSWLQGDEPELEALMIKLMRRRNRVPDLLRESTKARLNPFPNWK
ncbi:MAG: HipA family kinase [Bryobacteraceae bacterium]